MIVIKHYHMYITAIDYCIPDSITYRSKQKKYDINTFIAMLPSNKGGMVIRSMSHI